MVSQQVLKELDRLKQFGEKLDQIVSNHNYPIDNRNRLMVAYWSVVSECLKGLHALLLSEFCAPAFALLRPVLECLVRAHVAIKGSDKDIEQINADAYKVNFKTIGPWIDKEFGLHTLMTDFLNDKTRDALHSYTHGGIQQLGRRFKGTSSEPNYSEAEILEVIRVTTSALFMVANLLMKHFGFEEDWEKVSKLYQTWGEGKAL